MQVTIFIIFLVLIFLIGMRVWFLIKHDKTKTFWDTVYDVLHGEDSIDNNDNSKKNK